MRDLGLGLYIWTTSEVMNAEIREMCGMAKGLRERIDGAVLHWFGNEVRMEHTSITKVYVGE